MRNEIHETACDERYLCARGLDPEKVIYFDIETTGLRASSSQLYMIGWAVRRDDAAWQVFQYFAESYAEELILLKLFYEVLRRYDTVISFNGSRFDLPYLREKCMIYHIPDPFAHMTDVDLYKEIKPYKSVLGLMKLNQKSVERFLQITRDDPYSGGELIDVYRSVRSQHSSDPESDIRALYLHNLEDVLGMLKLTPLLAYPMIFAGTSPVCAVSSHSGNTVDSDLKNPEEMIPSSESACSCSGAPVLEASFCIPVPVPVDICIDRGVCVISTNGDLITVRIMSLRGCLRHDLPNPKDYYYLPEEDLVIHKSVAQFVDKNHRVRAKAENCCIKKEGCFLPQTGLLFEPAFRKEYRDKQLWFEWTDDLFQDREKLTCYIHSML